MHFCLMPFRERVLVDQLVFQLQNTHSDETSKLCPCLARQCVSESGVTCLYWVLCLAAYTWRQLFKARKSVTGPDQSTYHFLRVTTESCPKYSWPLFGMHGNDWFSRFCLLSSFLFFKFVQWWDELLVKVKKMSVPLYIMTVLLFDHTINEPTLQRKFLVWGR